jgi:hypothetical protein
VPPRMNVFRHDYLAADHKAALKTQGFKERSNTSCVSDVPLTHDVNKTQP